MKYDDKIVNFRNGSYIIVIDHNDIIKDIKEKIIYDHEIKEQDYYEIAVEGSIKIEYIRNIKKNIHLKSSGKTKLLLIENIEKLTLDASNSLLKLLEEPPKNTIITLFVHNIYQILPTITSRCKKIYLRSKNKSDLNIEFIKYLDKIINSRYLYEKIKITENIVKNKVNITNMLKEWIMYLRSLKKKDQYKKIKIINYYLKQYKSGVNQKLLLENIAINI